LAGKCPSFLARQKCSSRNLLGTFESSLAGALQSRLHLRKDEEAKKKHEAKGLTGYKG
jgi:hypothetical protein